ncbi:MAG TPA: hypothetical protein VK030_03465 [Actinomycetales bacterium]|nr:hypothetical protein [Actinomycetales bacterium]
MALFAGNNDSLRDRELLGARVNPSDEVEPDPEVDPAQLPEWDDEADVVFEDASDLNDSLTRDSGSEADVVDQFREEPLNESEYDEQE